MNINLIELLKDLPLSNVDNYGTIILYTDIMDALRLRGFDNHDLLNCHLQKLESDGILELHYCIGCEDLIVGATIK